MKYQIFRVVEKEPCSDYSRFNCSKINSVGEIRHAYLVLVEVLLR